jgi:ATP-dependent DNA helicase RecQ
VIEAPTAHAKLLAEVFGHKAFRPGQEEIVESVLSGRPTLAVMPTGAGKSLCYQLPALCFDKLTVVVSPLVALIRDQVGALQSRGVAARALTSLESEDAKRLAIQELRSGKLKLLYVAPERFRSPQFASNLEGIVSLLAIDEAHCISTWGHDFRPDYARLGEVIREVRPERVVALTATATPEVRSDIVRSLRLEGANVVVTGFDRPNLSLSVVDARTPAKKIDAARLAIDRWLGARREGTAIVYTATRKRSEEVAAALHAAGFRAEPYHAGLSAESRGGAQERFEKGELDVVVATTAFGMGVDKSNVRVVVHYDVPQSPEGYYQEVGRAGRDGAPAGGVLLYDPGDLRWAYARLEASCPTAEAVDRAFERLSAWSGGSGVVEGGIDDLADRLEPDVGPSARAALVTLDRSGSISLLGHEAVVRRPPSTDRDALDRRERVERMKLDAMIGYVQRAPCRRRYLTDYFGDPHAPERCGSCDRCALPRARALDGRALTDALKALSCVARMRGRFGKGRVVDVLLGSKSKQVLEANLDRLSTYGLLSHLSREDVLAILDSLARADLVASTIDEYPKLTLTKLGAETLKTRAPIEIDLRLDSWGDTRSTEKTERTKSPPQKPSLTVDDADRPLLEACKSWRREEASRAGMPPYVVAHDRTLEAVAALRPDSLEELAEVPGIGKAKLEKYGDRLLAIVRAHPRTSERTSE